MFSVSDIDRLNKQKVNIKKETFKIILKKFSHKIQNTYLSGGDNTLLKVPPMIIGYPMYDIGQATWYLKRQLELLGYRTMVPFDGTIYVTWAKEKKKKKVLLALPAPAAQDQNEDLSSLTKLRETAKKLKTRK